MFFKHIRKGKVGDIVTPKSVLVKWPVEIKMNEIELCYYCTIFTNVN